MFSLRQTIPTGPGGFSVTVGDFNQDQAPDLAALSILGGNKLHLFTGETTTDLFTPAGSIAIDNTATALFANDVDGDRDLDLSVSAQDGVGILLNDGAANFVAAEAAGNALFGEEFCYSISAGGGETQKLRVTATSDMPSLIPYPTVTYTSDDATGSLSFTPVRDQTGTANIEVIVADVGLDGVFDTADDGERKRMFAVVVDPLNDPPTLDALNSPLTIDEDRAVDLSLVDFDQWLPLEDLMDYSEEQAP